MSNLRIPRATGPAVLLATLTLAGVLATAHPVAAADLVAETRALIAAGNLGEAERLAATAVEHDPADPEALLALSWVGRGALAAQQFNLALRVAGDTEKRVLAALRNRPLDREPSVPLALGAAYEVQAQALAAQGARSEALLLLNRALGRFDNTSIQARLQKNVHLIGLKGQAMPPLATDEYLTDARMKAGQGQPTLLFFWAHWCADCKLFAKTLTAVQREFGNRGLRVVAPTQRYGYIGSRDDVPPAEEARHIRQIQREFYPTLTGIPIPLSAKNFAAYGVSTTPTLVLVDRAGRVQRYQPGGMAAADLRQAIAALF